MRRPLLPARDALTRALGLGLLLGVPFGLALGWLGYTVADGPGCPFRAVTGLPCPFCGMTHATFALGHGDLGAALCAHPLAPLVLLAVGWCGWRLFRRPATSLPAWPLVAGIAVIWTVNLLAHIHKLCG